MESVTPRFLFIVCSARGYIRAIEGCCSGVNLAGAAHSLLQACVNFDLARGMQGCTEFCEIWQVSEDRSTMEKILTVY